MSSHASSRNNRLREVLDLAMERPPEERAATVDQLCHDDEALRAEAHSLLDALNRAGHLLEPALPAPASKPLTGLTIGPYQIGDRIGAGGMGVVYRATDTRLGRTVAVKALPHSLASDPMRRARLEREARILAALNHPNIAAIHGIEDSPQGPVLVLEHVEGESLADRLKRGPIALDDCRAIANQILLALEAAHGVGIIHRDIKPANIMLTPAGAVKVLDLGVARQFPLAAAPSGSDSILLTHTGSFVGTAAYMSPEQARGRATDRRTDIWGFGCVLFEMLSGHSAFDGETISDTIASVLRAQPDWSRLPASIPVGVRHIIARCLEKDPARRLRDAGDARLELEEAWDAPPPQPPLARRSTLALAALCTLAGLAVGAAALSWIRPRVTAPDSTPVRLTISVSQDTPLRTDAYGGCVAVSPDGRTIVYSAGPLNPGPRLYIHRLDSFEDTPIPGTEHAFTPFFSPDGLSIGFTDLRLDGATSLKRVALDGGPVQTLAVVPLLGYGSCFGPDGSVIFADFARLKRIPPGGGEPTDITEPNTKSLEAHRSPELLPDGQTVLFACLYRANDEAAIRIEAVSLQTGKRTVIVNDASMPRFLPDLSLLVFRRQGSIVAAPFDPHSLRLTGEPRLVLGPTATGYTSDISYGISRRGTIAYVLGPDIDHGMELAWFYADGRTEPIFHAQSPISTLRLSPDATRIAYSTHNPTPGLWVLDIDRQTNTRITPTDGDEFPVWSPDGKRVAFSMVSKGTNVIAWAPADASAPPSILFASPDDHRGFPTGFSPDGKELLISQAFDDAGDTDIFVLTMPDAPGKPAVSSRRIFTTPADRAAARFSPDGTLITYTSNESGRSDIYLQDYPALSRKIPVSPDGGERAAWSADGATIFFKNYDALDSVRLAPIPSLSVSKPTRLLTHLPFSRYDPSPDGTRFVMSRASGEWVAPTRVYVVINPPLAPATTR